MSIIVWFRPSAIRLLVVLAVAALWFGTRGSGAPTGATALSVDRTGAVASSEYTGEGLSVEPTPAGARLRSDFQKLNGDATRGGLWVTSTVPGEDARLRLMATRVGRVDRTTRLAGSGTVSRRKGVVAFVRRGLTEEYSTSVDGVRQDFIIDRQPAGSGTLQVDLALAGATARQASRAATLTLNGSGRKLAYSRLHVADATGRALTATLDVVAADHLLIRVDDADAVYPVRIDPTFSDADWVSLNPGVAGTNGTVNAMVTDASNNVYIGGAFTLVGAVPANNIAKWDGTQWTALGTGTGNTVLAMAASGNDIYVGGDFTSAGGVANTLRIAKWDGSAWTALGTGANSRVSAVMLSAGTLHVGGQFTTIGGVAAGALATWNGSVWSAFGGSGVNGQVNALATLGTDVYIGCNCTLAGGVAVSRIAQWSTTTNTWSVVGAGNTGVVTAFGVLGGELYAAATGNFTTTTGTTTGIAKWDPSTSQWLALGTGTNFGGASALLINGGNVFIGGAFTTAGGTPAVNIAKWDGSAWSSVGTGTEGSLPGQNSTVSALTMVGTDLYAGGTFLSMGGTAAHGLAKWDGSAWSTAGIGLDNNVNAMVMSGTTLYIGGNFISAPNGVTVNRIAKWNGTTWSALGTGVNHLVNALAVDGSGNLYAGGRFTVAGGVAANLIAKWNGTAWSAMGSGISGNVSVNAIAVNSAGDVFVGGNFTGSAAGGVANTNRIARWNGSAWSALGTGLDNNLVSAIATVGTDVYVGGSFTLAGGLTVNRIAKWDGAGWSALSTGMNNNVLALMAAGTDLYVGGGFTTAGAVTANRIAKWDGSAWSALGGGTSSTVNAVAVDNGGGLYAGGVSTLAKWDGSAWSSLGSGVSGNVQALAADASGHLFVGGSFTTVGAGLISPYLARADVNVNDAPVANAGADQSATATSASGATVVLDGAASSDSNGDTLTYAWTNDFDGTTLTGAAPSTTVPFGAHVFTLTVTDAGLLTSTDTVVVTVSDTLTINGVTPPQVATTYTFAQVVPASYSCTSAAGLLASCVGTVANGSAINTASTGSQPFAVTATNTRGESTTSSWTYTVVAASSAVTVTCPTSVTYTGAAQTPCTAAASGAGMSAVDVSASLVYLNNTAAGTATVSASWGGDANHSGSAGLGNFAIGTKALTASVTAANKAYDATTTEPNANMTCTLSGVISADSANVTCAATNGVFAGSAVGSYAVTATATISGTASGNYTLGAAGTSTTSTSVAATGTGTPDTTADAVWGQNGSFTTRNTGVTATTLASDGPYGVVVDASGNMYVADAQNHRILYFAAGSTTATRVYGQGGSFTTNTVNKGGRSANSLSAPAGMALDSSGNLYVTDAGNNRKLYFPAGSTTATRVYGQNGSFATATDNLGGVSATSVSNSFGGIATDSGGNLYVADSNNSRVLFYPAGSTTATRVYGQGGSFTASAQNTGGISANSLNYPGHLAVDASDNLYISDTLNNRVLFYPAGQTTATRVYGQGGSFTTNSFGTVSASSLTGPRGIALDKSGNLYVTDRGNSRILYFPAGSTTATQVYGQLGSFTTRQERNGGITATSLSYPLDVSVDGSGNLFVADQDNLRVLKFNAGPSSITTAAVTTTLTAANKTYDGTTTEPNANMSCTLSGVVAADAANVACTATSGTFSSAAVGSRTVTATVTISGTASGNYTLGAAGTSTTSTSATATASITSGALTATLTAAGKTYDGTTTEPNANMSCALSGASVADAANVACTATSGTFSSAAVGSRTVTATVALSGTASGNYTLASTAATTTATITTAALTASVTAANKTYDATTTEPNANMTCALSGVLSADSANVACTATNGVFAGSAVGSYAVTATVTISGTASGNYTLGAAGTSTTSTTVTASSGTPDATADAVWGQNGSFTTSTTGVTASTFSQPGGLVADANGNLYVADTLNNRVLYFPAGSTTATRVYGQNGSFTANASNLVNANTLSVPRDVALDSGGNLYVLDQGNARVLFYPVGSTTATKVWGQNGSFTTNGSAVSATQFVGALAFALDSADNLYVADTVANRVLFFPAGSTTATRVYGQNGSFTVNFNNNTGGVGNIISATSLAAPRSVAVDSAGNLYVADYSNHRVLYYPAGSTTATRVYGQNGNFTTAIQNNTGGSANVVSARSLLQPQGVSADGGGNLYILDLSNFRVLYYPSGSTTATQVYGQLGSFTSRTQNNGGVSAASLGLVFRIKADASGNLYLADSTNNRVLRYNAAQPSITTAALTATLTAANKTYDGTTTEPDANMSCTLSGVLAADAGNVTCTATSGTFSSAAVGSRTVTATVTISGTAAGNYTLGAAGTSTTSASKTAPASITGQAVTATVTAANKTYNGNANATITSCTLTGVVNGDTTGCAASATAANNQFDSASVGTGKTVTATSLTLTGAAAGNYTLTSTTATTTADITTAAVTATLTAAGKTYDGTTTEPNANMSCALTGVAAADAGTATCTATSGTFSSAAVGSRIVTATVTISGTAAGNYTLGAAGTSTTSTSATATASITAAIVTASITAADKTYDGTTVEPTSNVICTLSGVVAADSANAVCAVSSATFSSPSVGSRTVTATVALSGTASGNYTLVSTAPTAPANITTAALTAAVAAANKTYDATTTEPDANLTCTLSGVLAADSANVTCAATNGVFAGSAVGSYAVTATATISGSASSNYTLGAAGTSVTSTTATAASGTPDATADFVWGQNGSFTTATSGLTASTLNGPSYQATDATGNVYITDHLNNRVLYYPAGSATATRVYGQNGSFTTNGSSTVTANSLSVPNGLVVDSVGGLYIADPGNARVLYFAAGSTTATRVYGQGGLFTTNTGNQGGLSATSLSGPSGLALDTSDNLYIVDRGNNRVLYYPSGSTMATRVYGQLGGFATGTANNGGITANSLRDPIGATVDGAGNLYVSDYSNSRVLYYPSGSTTATRVYGQNGSFTTGSNNNTNGTANVLSASSLLGAVDVRLDPNGNLYVADQLNFRVLYYPAGSTTAAQVYGQLGSFATRTANSGGVTATSLSNQIFGIWVDSSGHLYVSDTNNNRVLKFNASQPSITTAGLTATLTAANKTYDGTTTEPDANMSCTLSGVLAADAANVTCTATSGTFSSAAVGSRTVTATVTISGTAAGNYTLGAAGTSTTSTSKTATASITGQAVTAAITASNKTYNGNANATITGCTLTSVVSGDTTGCAVSVTVANNQFDSASVGTGKTVTATGITLTNNASGNYTLTSTTATTTANITTAALTATLTAAGKTYDGTTTEPNASLSCTVTGVVVADSANVTCTAASASFDSATAGARTVTATVTISGAASGNYTLGAAGTTVSSTSATAAAAITKASSTTTVTCWPVTTVYTGAAQELCAATVTGVGGLSLTPAPTYADNTNVGTATASYSYAGDANHDASTASATFAITPASLTVTADNKSKLIGSADPAFTYQVAGLRAGDTAASVLTGTLARDAGEAAGSYTIRQGTLAANGNYTLSVVTGTLTIGYNTCLLYDPTKAVKSGATIPLKIRLCSATGANVSNAATVVAAVALMRVSNSATGEVVDAGNSNADGNFRFDVSLGPGYIFNFKTTGLTQGTYRLELRVTNDSQPHFLTFQVR